MYAAAAAAAAAKLLRSCLTLRDPIDGSLPGSPVRRILQARILEWVAISFSNAWKWKVKGKSLSRVRFLATPWTAAHQAPPSMGFSRQEYWSGVPLHSPYIMYIYHKKLTRIYWGGLCIFIGNNSGLVNTRKRKPNKYSKKSVCMCAKFLQSCTTFCDPMNYSLPGSSVHGILPARGLKWVAMPFFKVSSLPRDGTCVSYVTCLDRQVLYH